MRIRSLFCLALVGSVAHAQTPAAPQTYSITELNNVITPNLTVKLYRDGAREVMDQIGPKSASNPKGYHMRMLYDFQAHKLYSWDLIETARPCGVQDNPEGEVPEVFDIVSGAAKAAAEIAKRRPKPVVLETLPVGSAWTYQRPDPAGKGKTKYWFTVKGDYMVKVVFIPTSGPPQIIMDVTALSFEKPPASMFALPPTCANAQLIKPPARGRGARPRAI